MTFKCISGQKGQNWQKRGLVRTINFKGLKLGSPNLANRCIIGRSRMGLYMTGFDLDLQGNLGSERSKSAKKPELVHAITFQGLNLGSPNLANSCILRRLHLGWDCIWWNLTLTFKVILG